MQIAVPAVCSAPCVESQRLTESRSSMRSPPGSNTLVLSVLTPFPSCKPPHYWPMSHPHWAPLTALVSAQEPSDAEFHSPGVLLETWGLLLSQDAPCDWFWEGWRVVCVKSLGVWGSFESEGSYSLWTGSAEGLPPMKGKRLEDGGPAVEVWVGTEALGRLM